MMIWGITTVRERGEERERKEGRGNGKEGRERKKDPSRIATFSFII